MAAQMQKLLFLVGVLAMTACGPSNQASNPAPALVTIKDFNAALSRPPEQSVRRETLDAVQEANQDLGITTLRANHVGTDDITNFVVSPAQVSHALAMLMLGAENETYRQLLAALHLPDPTLFPDNQGAELYDAIAGLTTNDYLTINTASWGRENYLFSVDYLNKLSGIFEPDLYSHVFTSGQDNAKAIVDWYSLLKLQSRIELIIDTSGVVNERTRLIHASALQFSAGWMTDNATITSIHGSFEYLDTFEREYQMSVPMLKISGNIPYYRNASYEAFELTLLDKPVSLLLITPFHRHFDETIYNLYVHELANIDTNLSTGDHTVYLPLFTVQDSLPNLGLYPDADSFSKAEADFSGVNKAGYLFLAHADHYSWFSLDDTTLSGEAASLTINEATIDEPAWLLNDGGGIAGFEMTFPVNTKPCYAPAQARPFIFIVRDTANKRILFIGKIGQLAGTPVTPISEVSIYNTCP